ncbi:MAG: iron chelate uptake ABC transporter family permease subunit [Thermoanaerobaculia bacterium]
MLEMLEFMAAPFAACVVLVGIHAYLGLHVLLRGVIFVDLALAQIAALGTVIALVSGHPPGSYGSITFSLGATIVGAAVFAITRRRSSKIPQEAIIGLTFVIASAAAILVADQAPEGAEQIKELLAGSILWVTWPRVVKIFMLYTAVGLFHYLFRRRFTLISEDSEKAFAMGWNVRLWDFWFYASFGVVITLSVQIAGVLMVFSYLVAPAIIALALSSSWPARIAIGCAVGLTGSILGLIASYRWDMPSGPAIVCFLGVILAFFVVTQLLSKDMEPEG